jgi:hypothetical protein
MEDTSMKTSMTHHERKTYGLIADIKTRIKREYVVRRGRAYLVTPQGRLKRLVALSGDVYGLRNGAGKWRVLVATR